MWITTARKLSEKFSLKLLWHYSRISLMDNSVHSIFTSPTLSACSFCCPSIRKTPGCSITEQPWRRLALTRWKRYPQEFTRLTPPGSQAVQESALSRWAPFPPVSTDSRSNRLHSSLLLNTSVAEALYMVSNFRDQNLTARQEHARAAHKEHALTFLLPPLPHATGLVVEAALLSIPGPTSPIWPREKFLLVLPTHLSL